MGLAAGGAITGNFRRIFCIIDVLNRPRFSEMVEKSARGWARGCETIDFIVSFWVEFPPWILRIGISLIVDKLWISCG